ncbi:MAG: hypothetical protein AAGE52_26290 [Myxococcota bacterium]
MVRAIALVLLVGCGSSESPPPTEAPPETQSSRASEPVVEDEDEADEAEELAEEEAEEGPPRSLDDMDRGELEAECYEGRQAACDRLGH